MDFLQLSLRWLTECPRWKHVKDSKIIWRSPWLACAYMCHIDICLNVCTHMSSRCFAFNKKQGTRLLTLHLILCHMQWSVSCTAFALAHLHALWTPLPISCKAHSCHKHCLHSMLPLCSCYLSVQHLLVPQITITNCSSRRCVAHIPQHMNHTSADGSRGPSRARLTAGALSGSPPGR